MTLIANNITKIKKMITRRIIDIAGGLGLLKLNEFCRCIRKDTNKVAFEKVKECVYLGTSINRKSEEEKTAEAAMSIGSRYASALNYMIRSKHLWRKKRNSVH